MSCFSFEKLAGFAEKHFFHFTGLINRCELIAFEVLIIDLPWEQVGEIIAKETENIKIEVVDLWRLSTQFKSLKSYNALLYG